ncbi:noggin-2-like isoform X2 [Xiphias gladius]|uniref:noggin-2-like isoform X2 n=1 Tax=Xiphias gladius TaxID=8245 RepID=UPI001A99E8BA|nr:noggin-2-like isoform X2 [Xiphias gladius]
MFKLLNCVCLCWISVSVLLHGLEAFTFNISTQNQLPNVSVVQDPEDTGWDSPFLQLRTSLLSLLKPIRPYNLLTNTEDYHHLPRPRHHRPSHLLRLLGSSFDPFWMSVEQPFEASVGPLLHGDTPPAKLPNYPTIKEKSYLSSSPELRESGASHRKKLEKDAAGLDFGSLPSDIASSVRSWLVRSATCELYYQWMDLGPAFWPRWLRQTDCERSGRVRSCSFPSGMECVRAQTTHIKILAWHCLEIRDGGDGSRKIVGERYNGSTEVGTTEAMKRKVFFSNITLLQSL